MMKAQPQVPNHDDNHNDDPYSALPAIAPLSPSHCLPHPGIRTVLPTLAHPTLLVHAHPPRTIPPTLLELMSTHTMTLAHTPPLSPPVDGASPSPHKYERHASTTAVTITRHPIPTSTQQGQQGQRHDKDDMAMCPLLPSLPRPHPRSNEDEDTTTTTSRRQGHVVLTHLIHPST
jgi:hypothetical protein